MENDLLKNPGETNVDSEKDFDSSWGEMIEDTFAVALERLDMETEEIGKVDAHDRYVTCIERHGCMLVCSVTGYVPELTGIFKDDTEVRLRVEGEMDTYRFDFKRNLIRRKKLRLSTGAEVDSISLTAVVKGCTIEEDDAHQGTVRLHLELTSKGELPKNSDVSVAPDLKARARRVKKESMLLDGFLDRVRDGNMSEVERRFLSGDFVVKPDGALSKSPDLDGSQNKAYGRAMLFEDYPILIIQGPPGTGKTRGIREIVDGHIRFGRKVLVLSHSNRGKDEPAKQLLDKWEGDATRGGGKEGDQKIFIAGNAPDKIDPDLQRLRIRKNQPPFPKDKIMAVDAMSDDEIWANRNLFTSGEFFRGYDGTLYVSTNYGTDSKSEIAAARKRLKDAIVFDHEAKVRKAREKFTGAIAKGGAVFSTFGSLLNDETLANIEFDVVVVDEATRMRAPELVMALQRAGKQIIFVGDPEQLGNIPVDPDVQKGLAERLKGNPVPAIISSVRSAVSRVYDVESAVRAVDVYEDGPYKKGIKCADDPYRKLPFVFLDQGRRSLPNITGLVSDFTYGGRLKSARVPKDGEGGGTVLWLDTRNLRSHERTVGTSRRNPVESSIIGRRVVDALKREKVSPSDIGVVATYAEQVEAIRNGVRRILMGTEEGKGLLEKLSPNIDSVDGFQGDQRNGVYMSFVRSNKEGNVGFTDEGSRINVGISRARDSLVIVGDTSTLIDNNADSESKARFQRLRDLVEKYGEVRAIKFHQERKRKRLTGKARRECRREKAKEKALRKAESYSK
jgi:hypothetical protein